METGGRLLVGGTPETGLGFRVTVTKQQWYMYLNEISKFLYVYMFKVLLQIDETKQITVR